MKQQRDVSNWQVLGLLLLIASGVALVVLFAVADGFGADSQHCLHNGPFPAAELGALEGGSVGQSWQWAPMGVRCDWLKPDGRAVTTTSASWSRNSLAACVVVGAIAGATLSRRRRRQRH